MNYLAPIWKSIKGFIKKIRPEKFNDVTDFTLNMCSKLKYAMNSAGI